MRPVVDGKDFVRGDPLLKIVAKSSEWARYG